MEREVKVLVVDDDRRMVRTMLDILLMKGFGAEPAYDGAEAVAKVQASPYDLVLMDLKMPGNDGLEALRGIRGIAPEMPVVLMSAYASDEEVAEAKTLGACNILSKPVDLQMLLSFLSVLKRGPSVLIVDDDPGFCRTLNDILQSRGYRVATEGEPDRALDILERQYALVVIVDAKLGSADAVATMERIRARYPTKPVIVVTAYREQMIGSLEQAIRAGAHTCFYKPFEVDALLNVIEEIRNRKLGALLGTETASGAASGYL